MSSTNKQVIYEEKKICAKYFESLLQQINPENKIIDLSNERYILQYLASAPRDKHTFYFIMRNDITKHYFNYLILQEDCDPDTFWTMRSSNDGTFFCGSCMNAKQSDLFTCRWLAEEDADNCCVCLMTPNRLLCCEKCSCNLCEVCDTRIEKC